MLDMNTPAGLLERGFPLDAEVAAIGTDIGPVLLGLVNVSKSDVGYGIVGGDFPIQPVASVNAGIELVAEVVLAIRLFHFALMSF